MAAGESRSEPERIGLRRTRLGRWPAERRDGRSLVEPEISVELLWQRGANVMARKLRLRPVDHADHTLEPRREEALANAFVAPKVEQELRQPRFVTKTLVTIAMRGTDGFDLHLAVPMGRGGHLAAMRAEADQGDIVAPALTAELTETELAMDLAQIGVTRVADMRIMRPDDRLRFCAVRVEKMGQRFAHMPVAQIPGLRSAVIHGSVIALGGGDQARVLRGVEEALDVAAGISQPALQQLAALRDDLLFAAPIVFGQHGAAIIRRLASPRVQATIAFAGDRGRRLIPLVEISEDRRDRGAQIVEIEPVKARLPVGRDAAIVRPQPAQERRDVSVAPHPSRKAGEGRRGGSWKGLAANEAIDNRGVGPIRLDRDDAESVCGDETARDRRARSIEFRRAMARFSKQHDPPSRKTVEERTELGTVDGRQKVGGVGDQRARRLAGGRVAPFLPSDDERHKAHRAEILGREAIFGLAGDLEKPLLAWLRADGNDQTPADRKLLPQLRRRGESAGGDQNDIERRGLGEALRAVADAQVDIFVTELAQPSPRGLGEVRPSLDRVDLRRDSTQRRRGVTRSGADLENFIAALHRGRLDHQGDNIGLRDHLPLADRQRRVVISEVAQAGRDERLARD